MDYLPTKFQVYVRGVVELLDAQVVFFFGGGGLPTDRQTYRYVQSNMSLPSFEGGHKNNSTQPDVNLTYVYS